LEFRLLSPGDGDHFAENEKIYIKMKQTGPEDIRKYFIYLNGTYLASTTNNKFSFRPRDVKTIIKKGDNLLKVAGQGISGDRLEKYITIKID
jgi:hypothetical protein